MAVRGILLLSGLIVASLVGTGGMGCAASQSRAQRWAEQRGGTVGGAASDRARAALARLEASGTMHLTVAVLDRDDLGAYGWECGAIFVTRGLVERVDDEELAAAIAHEAGHLLVDGHLPRGAALDGCRRACGARPAEDAEMAADRMGRELLRVSSLPEQALQRLLGKLASDPATPRMCREHLTRRMAALGEAPQDHQ